MAQIAPEGNEVSPTKARQEGFDRLYAETFRPLLAYCRRRCRESTQAEDAVAEVFLVAWRRWEDVAAADSSLAWLYGVAYRVLGNHYRSQSRSQRLKQKIFSQRVVLEVAGPAQQIENSHQVAQVFSALKALPPREQEIIRLLVFEELSYEEIALATGLSAGSVRSRLYRARKKLKKILDEEELREEPALLDTRIKDDPPEVKSQSGGA